MPKAVVLPGPHDLDYVTANMREEERLDCDCFGVTKEDATRLMVDLASHIYTAFVSGEAVFIFGVVPHDGTTTVSLFGFGTDKTKRVMPAVTRFVHETWIPAMYREGTRRIEVVLPVKHLPNIEWLQSFGMVAEEVVRAPANDLPMIRLALNESEFERHVHRTFQTKAAPSRLSTKRARPECARVGVFPSG